MNVHQMNSHSSDPEEVLNEKKKKIEFQNRFLEGRSAQEEEKSMGEGGENPGSPWLLLPGCAMLGAMAAGCSLHRSVLLLLPTATREQSSAGNWQSEGEHINS